jgi:hypothetical protein
MSDRYTIFSVLGFDLKADIKDQDGKILASGVKRTVIPTVHAERVNTRLFDKRFFTTFNEGLLAKVRDCRRLND